jgi:sarcosine oxidase subunit alpha
MRITPDSPLAPAARGAPITLWIDGQPVTAYAGETLAGVLFATGRRAIHRAPAEGQAPRPRGVYCGMGVCFECLVWIETPSAAQAGAPAQRSVRACLTAAEDGMHVRTTPPRTP